MIEKWDHLKMIIFFSFILWKGQESSFVTSNVTQVAAEWPMRCIKNNSARNLIQVQKFKEVGFRLPKRDKKMNRIWTTNFLGGQFEVFPELGL